MPAADFRLLRFIGLCPVLTDIAKSPNARVASIFFPLRSVAELAAAAASHLPESLLQMLVHAGLMVERYSDSACRNDTAHAVLQLVNRHVVKNFLHLALDEMDTLHGPEPLDAVIQSLGRRAVFVYSPVDGWIAPGAGAELQTRFPESTFVFKDEKRLCHMFSLNLQSTTRMATCTWEHVKSVLHEVLEQPRARM